MKYLRISLWTDSSNFDRVRSMLMSRYCLVPPKDDPFNRTIEQKLIFEDGRGVGIYRVDFLLHHPRGHLINFRYWYQRIDGREIEGDPMLDAALDAHELVKPCRISVPHPTELDAEIEEL